jgi:hypothetical protein
VAPARRLCKQAGICRHIAGALAELRYATCVDRPREVENCTPRQVGGHTRAPCAKMIERQIDGPIPRSPGFVGEVRNAMERIIRDAKRASQAVERLRALAK